MPRTLLLMEITSVFAWVVSRTIGVGRTSEAAPQAFCRRVSLGVNEPVGHGKNAGLAGTGTIFPAASFLHSFGGFVPPEHSLICMQLNGPLELLPENSQAPAVLRSTVLTPAVEL